MDQTTIRSWLEIGLGAGRSCTRHQKRQRVRSRPGPSAHPV